MVEVLAKTPEIILCTELHPETEHSGADNPKKRCDWRDKSVKLKPPPPPHPVCRVIPAEICSHYSYNCLYLAPHLQQYNSLQRGKCVILRINTWLKDMQARENMCLTHTTGKTRAFSCSMERYVWTSSVSGLQRDCRVRLCIIRGSTVTRRKDAGFLYLGAQFSLTTAPCQHSKTIFSKMETHKNYAEVPHVATQIWEKNKLWEHAGCDGTPNCVAVPGVAACLRSVVCWSLQPAGDRRCTDWAGRTPGSSSRILMPSFFLFLPVPLHIAWFTVSGKGHACDLCWCWWAHSAQERNQSTLAVILQSSKCRWSEKLCFLCVTWG